MQELTFDINDLDSRSATLKAIFWNGDHRGKHVVVALL